MIDEKTREVFELCRKKALREGIDLLEVLDKAGLIRNDASTSGDWADALVQLAIQLDKQPVTALVQLGGGQNTPLDTVRGVLEYIDFFIRQFQSQSGRSL